MKKYHSILLILKTYFLVLTVFFAFRFILFLTETDRINFNEVSFLTIAQAFIMGVRFDIVISGYILFIPALLLFTLDISNKSSAVIQKILFYWIFILFSLSFAIAAADIPYFNHFYSRFSIGAFEWIENLGFVLPMIYQEPKYFLIIFPLIAFIGFFFIFLKKIFKTKNSINRPNIYLNIFLSILVLSLMFLGIRGRIQKKSPIRIGTAYFSDNSFLNKLGLNPVFTLMRSYIDSKDRKNKVLNMMDNQIAIQKVQHYLNIKNPEYNSPIARKIIPDTDVSARPNIVLIIMESMSAAKMKRHGNTNKLTPFLDSLSNNSYYFENIYSAGKHTFNGVFSSLFSFPALYRQHPMKQIKKYDGMSSVLLKNVYTTTYFTTHDSQFDNIEGFLRENDFQNIISQKDYPSSEIKTTLGVPDDYMFRYSIPLIDKLSKKNKPFFITYMTASDHGPFFIPEYFSPKTKNIKQQIVEYADWSLHEFITLSSKKKWFDNTLFIFVADHGVPINATYDIALNYHHTPLILYAPTILQQNKVISAIGGQIDIFPTIMGILKLPYINNTLGVDLINRKRPYTIINDDDKIGVIDKQNYLILKKETNSFKLYKYINRDKTNYTEKYQEKATEMMEYAKANMQVYQYMLLNNKTTLQQQMAD